MEGELSEGSDVSDDSDIFHVAVYKDKWWMTEQDRDLDRAALLAESLREQPFVPPDPEDPENDWVDVSSGVRVDVRGQLKAQTSKEA